MKIIIHEKEYDYYDDSYLLDELKDYIKDNTLSLNNMPYEKVLMVYNYLCGYSTMLISEPFPTEELEKQNEEINKKINRTNHMQEYLKSKGKEKESINLMMNFIETILEFDKEYSKHNDEFVEEDNYGILR